MKTREVFAQLRPTLGGQLETLGFHSIKPRGSGLIAWSRELPSGQHVTVWFEVHKWPFDPWVGSKFCLEFQRAPVPDTGEVRSALRLRFGALASESELLRAQAIQNEVVSRCRVPTEQEHQAVLGIPRIVASLRERQCEPERFDAHTDIWFRYLDRNDVRAWAELLTKWLPKGLERFSLLDHLEGLGVDPARLPKWE